MKLGILGGTFDPIHSGHLALARAAMSQFHLDKVLFIPAYIPPHKKNRTDVAPANVRRKMVEIAIKDQAGFEVSTIEIDRKGISYTSDTLRELKKIYPAAEFYLIVGEDSLRDLPSWKDIDDIRKTARVAAARRRASASGQEDADVLWIQMPEYPISSSNIREELKKGKLSPGVLPEEIESYIRREKVYSR